MMQTPATILAGGRGMRLGGVDKALCTLNGRTLLAHCLSRLAPQSGPIAINANGDTHRFQSFDLPIISDDPQGNFGPLSGILAAMDWAAETGHTQVLTIAVDTPFFPTDLALRLQARPQDQIALAATRDAQGRLWSHPTFAMWPTGLRDQLREDLESGARKMMTWAEAQGAANVIFSAQTRGAQAIDPFFNINTPADLKRAEQISAAQSRLDEPR